MITINTRLSINKMILILFLVLNVGLVVSVSFSDDDQSVIISRPLKGAVVSSPVEA